jgi:multidrug efflux pump subunit AcrB
MLISTTFPGVSPEDIELRITYPIEEKLKEIGRFRPILFTTLTTMGGLLPTAYKVGGSDPLLIPMTLALGWGLGFGTFGSLLYIPLLFSIGNDIKTKMKK